MLETRPRLTKAETGFAQTGGIYAHALDPGEDGFKK